MLIQVKEGTKCTICGEDLTGRTIQGTSFTCLKCGTHYDNICRGHLCPKCGGMLTDPWASWKKEFGTNIIF